MRRISRLAITICIFIAWQLSFATTILFETKARFHPQIGTHAAVSSQESRATNVGIQILKEGGNAVDAAVATGFALAVTLPRAGGLGGGGFMSIWLQKQHKSLIIDYRETAPKAIDTVSFTKENGEVDLDKAINSWAASGVPGVVAGLCLAEEQYGKLGLQKVIQPAISLATNGFTVRPGLLYALQHSAKRLQKDPTAWKTFTHNNELYDLNRVIKQPALAHTLRLIAKYGKKGFYSGYVAKKIATAERRNNGVITKADLANYHPIVRKSISKQYHDYTIIAPPPPSSGGVTIFEMLNIAQATAFSHEKYPQNSAAEYHHLAEIMNFAFYDRNKYLGDPAFVEMPLNKLLSTSYAQSLAKKISSDKHLPSKMIDNNHIKSNESRNTTQYSVVDSEGNMVSNTTSLNASFGNGKMVPGTGILLNNTLDDFSFKSGAINVYGLKQGSANLIAPGKRPLSSMTPIIILDKNNQAWLASGTPGGPRIITTMLQLIIDMIDYRMPLAVATEAPRIHSQLWPDILYYESGISPDTTTKLTQLGHKLKESYAIGSVQSVAHKADLFYGFADTRRTGAAALAY